MKQNMEKAPAHESRRLVQMADTDIVNDGHPEKTITIQVVTGSSYSESAYEAYKRTRALIKHLKKQKNQMGGNHN